MKLLYLEAGCFALVIALLWCDELLDLPSVLLGARPTPVNWAESLAESVVVLLIAAGSLAYSRRLLLRINRLEGMLPICCHCKRVRMDSDPTQGQTQWVQLDRYVKDHSDVDFSHGVCPDCARKYYGEFGEDVVEKSR